MNLSCIFPILLSRVFICDSNLFSRFWIIYTIIIQNSLSGRFPISFSFFGLVDILFLYLLGISLHFHLVYIAMFGVALHKRRLYTWTSPDGQHQNQIDYILCSQRWRSSIQSAKTRSGADCDSDHELLIAKFRLKLKKVGKTTKPFRYDLNQILYDYTVEGRNRFKD